MKAGQAIAAILDVPVEPRPVDPMVSDRRASEFPRQEEQSACGHSSEGSWRRNRDRALKFHRNILSSRAAGQIYRHDGGRTARNTVPIRVTLTMLRCEGPKIVDSEGKEVILRGVSCILQFEIPRLIMARPASADISCKRTSPMAILDMRRPTGRQCSPPLGKRSTTSSGPSSTSTVRPDQARNSPLANTIP